jgi:hypothetical protein
LAGRRATGKDHDTGDCQGHGLEVTGQVHRVGSWFIPSPAGGAAAHGNADIKAGSGTFKKNVTRQKSGKS